MSNNRQEEYKNEPEMLAEEYAEDGLFGEELDKKAEKIFLEQEKKEKQEREQADTQGEFDDFNLTDWLSVFSEHKWKAILAVAIMFIVIVLMSLQVLGIIPKIAIRITTTIFLVAVLIVYFFRNR